MIVPTEELSVKAVNEFSVPHHKRGQPFGHKDCALQKRIMKS